MTLQSPQPFLEPTTEAVRKLLERNIDGATMMLNLLRFRDIADYSGHPELAPPQPISGRAAYTRYMNATEPLLQASGGEILFHGTGGAFLIGPADEWWDAVMLVRQRSVQTFLSFASDAAILECLGHRVAALADSRLLPLSNPDAFRE